jgi:hypothetical protein
MFMNKVELNDLESSGSFCIDLNFQFSRIFMIISGRLELVRLEKDT